MKWEKVELGNFVDFFNGKSIGLNGLGEYPAFGSNGLIGFSEKFLYTEGVILGRVGAYCGAVEISKTNFWASDNTIVVKPKENADLIFQNYNA